MRSRYLFPLLVILLGAMLIVACSSGVETTPADQPEEPGPAEIDDQEPYPYPAPDEIAQPEPDEAYPPAPNIIVVEPYPGAGEGEEAVVTNVYLASEFVPLPSDKDLQRGQVYIDSTELVMKESFPVQVELVVKGNLPTPCHALRIVASEPDDQGHIRLNAYSVTDPEKVCVQVLSPFEATVPLGDFTEGAFTVGINGEMVADFELP